MSITANLPHRVSFKHRLLSYALASILIVMLVSQLYTYDELSDALSVLLPAGVSSKLVMLLPAILVIIELVALCYALPLYLSKLARYISLVAIVAVPVAWAALLIAPIMRAQSGVYPILSTKIPLPVDIVSGVIVFILASLTAAVIYYDIVRHRLS